MKTGITETTISTRLTSLPPRKLPQFTLQCWYLFSLSDLFISRFVHDGKIHTVALTWASLLSVCQSGHCCNLLCFNPQEDSMHPPTRACQALLGLLAWRRTVWLKTTAVLFSHPVRQSNIIFEELHNKSFQVLLRDSIYINTPCLISYICKWLNVPASVSASVGMRAGGLGSGSEEYLIEETTVSRKTGGASGLFESVSGSGTGSRGRSSSKDGMRRTQDSPLFVEKKSKTTHSRRYDG